MQHFALKLTPRLGQRLQWPSVCVDKILIVTFFGMASTALGQQDTTATADSLLIWQLEQEMMTDARSSMQGATQRTAPSTNPDISAIGDFRSSYNSIGERRVELFLNELELQIASVVDPYARAEFLFSFGKDFDTGDLGIELEVATLTSLSLPYQLQVTLGKFKPQFGKVNILHPHYFSFIDFPKVINNFFDSEGMFMEGVSTSWLVPNPLDFYQELGLEVGRAGSEPNASLVQGDTDRLLYIGHLKNFFDLSENATLEWGLSALTGPNSYGYATSIAGVDFTYKWKPLQFSTYESFTWQSELLVSRMKATGVDIVHSFGGYSYAEYQIERRWFVGVRYDYSEFPGIDGQRDQSGTFLVRLQPTEFQVLALQYQYTDRNYGPDFSQVAFRVIFGIGKHAAHPY
jgi:hypothetical protein